MQRDKQPSMSPSQDLNPVLPGTKWERILLDGIFCRAVRHRGELDFVRAAVNQQEHGRPHVKLPWPCDWRKGKVVGQPRGHPDSTPVAVHVVAQRISFFGRVQDFRIINRTSSWRWEHFHAGGGTLTMQQYIRAAPYHNPTWTWRQYRPARRQ